MVTLAILQVVPVPRKDRSAAAAEDAREAREEVERTVIETGPGLAAESAAEKEGLVRIQQYKQREIALSS